MRRHLHLLNALRSFEIACKVGSFTGAAQEMSVTPGAVSRQITILEDEFGCPLFVRLPRGVQPTAKGAMLYRILNEAFNQIENVLSSIRDDDAFASLSILSYTTIAIEWLVPRVGSFYRENPEMSLHFYSRQEPSALLDGTMDAGIWNGPGELEGCTVKDLMFLEYLPVCSPSLLRNGSALRTPSDLKKQNLLGSRYQLPAWSEWLRAAGVNEIDPSRFQLFDNSAQAYRRARDGQGIMLGYRFINCYDIAAGTLVAPFDVSIRDINPWKLVIPENREGDPRIKAFEKWLRAEMDDAERVACSVLSKKMKTVKVSVPKI